MRPGAGIIVSLGAAAVLFFTCSKDNPTNPGGGIAATTRVLVISNYPAGNTFIADTFPAHLSGFTFSTWYVPDSVPTLAQLRDYDVVLAFENNIFNSDSTGDLLYDYVMQGGNLVLGAFYWQGRIDGGYNTVGWGQLETIDPIIADSGNAYLYDSTGTWVEHPLTRGLDTIYCYYGGGYDSLRSNATAVAWWKNGDVLMAYNAPSGRIVGVTLYPCEPRSRAGNYKGFYRAWENALLYAAWGDTRQ
jgi:hypothetical protein